MAKQKGIIKLEGSIGGITFMKTQDGYMAKEQTVISAERIATDPKFIRTRENGTEFGRGGKAAKLLRNAFETQIQAVKDNRITSRLVKAMMKVLRADTTSERGERNVPAGEVGFLEGFNCNVHSVFTAVFRAPFVATIDRASGIAEVVIAAFTPKISVMIPGGCTHFKFFSAGSEVDFETEDFTNVAEESDMITWDSNPHSAITLTHQLPAASEAALFLVLGIQFYQKVNGRFYELNSGASNALSIVKAEG